jgi:hypothetical protein
MNSRFWFRISMSSMIAASMLVSLNANGQGSNPARYTVTDLGAAGVNSFAYTINGLGMVTGGAAAPPLTNFVAQTPVIWYRGRTIPLGTLGGSDCPDCSGEGAGVAPNGVAALLSETAVSNGPTGEDFCEFGTHRQCLAAVSKRGVLTALPLLPGGDNSEAFFINDEGEAVGVSEIGAPGDNCLTLFRLTSFLPPNGPRTEESFRCAHCRATPSPLHSRSTMPARLSACRASARTFFCLHLRLAAQARHMRCCGTQTERPMT